MKILPVSPLAIIDVAGRFELPYKVLQTPTSPLGHATI